MLSQTHKLQIGKVIESAHLLKFLQYCRFVEAIQNSFSRSHQYYLSRLVLHWKRHL